MTKNITYIKRYECDEQPGDLLFHEGNTHACYRNKADCIEYVIMENQYLVYLSK